VARVGRAAMESAELQPSDIGALILCSCTPYEVTLGQDSFRFARMLGLDDDVLHVQMSAGCGGLARVMNLVADLPHEHVLILSYNSASALTYQDGPSEVYTKNDKHPFGSILWASPGIFSDGAGAIVLRKQDAEAEAGITFYSRDSHSFGDGPGFDDPIVHFPGGGVLNPPGFGAAEELSAFAMSGRIIAEYYNNGMLLNHKKMLELRPDYRDEVKRVYTHQAGPAMVEDFIGRAEIPRDKAPTNAAELGNLVSPCTLKLLHDDLVAGNLEQGDELCFELIGAGPERGAFTLRNRVRKVVEVALA
jgi:3-oxoacyl-[acyl-carrier-protein] synthase-3